jgi:hypothetical protein
MGVATMVQPASEYVDLIKAGRAPASFDEVLRGNKDPESYVASMQDPSLRKVSGRVTGITGLNPGEILLLQLMEGLRPGGLITSAEVAADGSFEVRNVSARTYQVVLLRTCRNCASSKVAAVPVSVVVGDKDVADLRLTFVAQ